MWRAFLVLMMGLLACGGSPQVETGVVDPSTSSGPSASSSTGDGGAGTTVTSSSTGGAAPTCGVQCMEAKVACGPMGACDCGTCDTGSYCGDDDVPGQCGNECASTPTLVSACNADSTLSFVTKWATKGDCVAPWRYEDPNGMGSVIVLRSAGLTHCATIDSPWGQVLCCAES